MKTVKSYKIRNSFENFPERNIALFQSVLKKSIERRPPFLKRDANNRNTEMYKHQRILGGT